MSILDKPFLGKQPEKVLISNSEIQVFKDCRRKWYLGNYLGLSKKEKEFMGPLKLGVRLHNALEMYYVDGIHPVEAYNRLMRVDNAEFLKTFESKDPKIVIKYNSEAELGRIMLEGYVEWLHETNADTKLKVKHVEKTLQAQIGSDPRVYVQGKVDMHVEREDGSTAIFDHKSAVSFDVYYKTAHMSEQLMTYISLEHIEDPTAFIDGGTYGLMKKVKRTATAKPPFYERMDVRFNDDSLESFMIRLEGTLRDIMSVRDALDEGQDHRSVAYPRPSNDCTWKCPFFSMCTMLDDGSNAAQYLEDNFEQVDPNERYLNKPEEN